MAKNVAIAHNGRRCLQASFALLYLGMLCTVIWTYIGDGYKNLPLPSPIQTQMRPDTASTEKTHSELHTALKDFESVMNLVEFESISPERWTGLVQDLFWAAPDRPITNLSMCTSPSHTTFYIQDPKKTYNEGDELFVTVLAKDSYNKTKPYGGDFFQAKLFDDKTKASVFGEVVDQLNGSYSVRFVLPWAGEAQVAVRLIHSSEAVQVLKRCQDNNSDRVYFRGFYEGVGPDGSKRNEIVTCNVNWNGNGLWQNNSFNCCCDYRDPANGEAWRCLRPKTLPCNALMYHSFGGYLNPLTALEKKLVDKSQTNIQINGDKKVINILSSSGHFEPREKCHPGLQTPVPAGFYMNDIWTTFICTARHFNSSETAQCLKDRHIYIMGDSTTRQWFDFLVQRISTLKMMNLHSSVQVGPRLAVDLQNNIDLHFRSHGLPLRSSKAEVAAFHYISNEIDDLTGGPHMVIVFNLGHHFSTYPLAYFACRVLRIRKSILALLQRSPATTIIIKTTNTNHKHIHGSDWYSLQLNKILKWAFEGLAVYFLDVWQMTSCHYNEDNIHPGPVIIKNEIDILLSFICPK